MGPLPRAEGKRLRLITYLAKSLRFNVWTNIAVALGVAVGTAALAGALLVGDSMRVSLRALAVGRLGPVDHALSSSRFFRTELADAVAKAAEASKDFAGACPVIVSRGTVVHASTQARVGRVNIFGVDRRFWNLSPTQDSTQPEIVCLSSSSPQN